MPKQYEMVVDLQSIRIIMTKKEKDCFQKAGVVLPSVEEKVRA